MFRLKCYGEINGKDITLIPNSKYRVRHSIHPSEELEDIFIYVSYNSDSLIFARPDSNSRIPVLFNSINSIKRIY